jgi:dsDNA-binding SOS-regulon protein
MLKLNLIWCNIKFDLGNSDLNEEQKEILTQFLNQNRNVFATNLYVL